MAKRKQFRPARASGTRPGEKASTLEGGLPRPQTRLAAKDDSSLLSGLDMDGDDTEEEEHATRRKLSRKATESLNNSEGTAVQWQEVWPVPVATGGVDIAEITISSVTCFSPLSCTRKVASAGAETDARLQLSEKFVQSSLLSTDIEGEHNRHAQSPLESTPRRAGWHGKEASKLEMEIEPLGTANQSLCGSMSTIRLMVAKQRASQDFAGLQKISSEDLKVDVVFAYSPQMGSQTIRGRKLELQDVGEVEAEDCLRDQVERVNLGTASPQAGTELLAADTLGRQTGKEQLVPRGKSAGEKGGQPWETPHEFGEKMECEEQVEPLTWTSSPGNSQAKSKSTARNFPASCGFASIVISGYIDAPSNVLSALLYLIRQRLVTLHAGKELSSAFVDATKHSFPLRVVLLPTVLSDSPEHPSSTCQRLPHKQMQLLMAWLRPEHSAQALAQFIDSGGSSSAAAAPRMKGSVAEGRGKAAQVSQLDATGGGQRSGDTNEETPESFNPLELYAAVKPTGVEPELNDSLPALLPVLRPYQRRAAFWMVEREQEPLLPCTAALEGGSHSPGPVPREPPLEPGVAQQSGRASCSDAAEPRTPAGRAAGHEATPGSRRPAGTPQAAAPDQDRQSPRELHALWVAVDAVEKDRRIYYNPYTGRFSLRPFSPECRVRGGILADEMGLGKTVELLACILAHPRGGRALQPGGSPRAAVEAGRRVERKLEQRRLVRVDCPCGAQREDAEYQGLWVQCEECLAWQHAACVGYKRPAKRKGAAESANEGLTGRKGRGGQPLSSPPGIGRGVELRKGEGPPASEATQGVDEEQRRGGGALGCDVDVRLSGEEAGELRVAGESSQRRRSKRQRVTPFIPRQAREEPQQVHGDRENEAERSTGGSGWAGWGSRGGRGRTWRKLQSCKPGMAGKEKVVEGGYVCGVCLEIMGGAEVQGECGATLVVCPTAILRQWQEEIARHTRPGSLRVVVYNGVQHGSTTVADLSSPPSASSSVPQNRQPLSNRKRTSPDCSKQRVVGAHDLATADIVLTTYETLRADLSHDSEEAGQRSMRYQKRYRVVPTPLTRLEWWRVCLDEAQLVESANAKATEMARRLQAVNRWCISGTPLQRGLDDLHGLLAFLRAPPFSERQFWTQVLQRPYEEGAAGAKQRLHAFLRPMMWRHSKADVAHELGLPPQQQLLSRLHFSPVEAHFYRRQHDECAAKARAVVARHRGTARGHLWRSEGRSEAGCHMAAQQRLSGEQASPAGDSGAAHAAAAEAAGEVGRAGPPEGSLSGIDSSGPMRDGRPSHSSPSAAASAAGGRHLPGSRGDGTLGGRRGQGAVEGLLSRAEAAKVLAPLLRLRQACCHPQVGSAGIRSLQAGSNLMSMEEILQVLVEKARLEAEEAQRLLVSALNGLAALGAVEGSPGVAIERYREALRSMDENAAEFGADDLQKLHTLHNLALLLGFRPGAGTAQAAAAPQDPGVPAAAAARTEGARVGEEERDGREASPCLGPEARCSDKAEEGNGSGGRPAGSEPPHLASPGTAATRAGSQALGKCSGLPAGVPRTLRDEWLVPQCRDIRDKYMAPFWTKLAAVEKEFRQVHEQVRAAQVAKQEQEQGSPWWLAALDLAARGADAGKELAERLRNHLLETDHLAERSGGGHQNASSLALRFATLHGLQLVMTREVEAMDAGRAAVLEKLEELRQQVEREDPAAVETAGHCRVCTATMDGPPCGHCRLQDLFQIYENRLFLLKTTSAGRSGLVSAEEAIEAQQRQAHRNRLGMARRAPGAGGAAQGPLAEENLQAGSRRRQTGAANAASAQVTWAPSEAERLLRLLAGSLRFIPGARSMGSLAMAAKRHLETLEALRREFGVARAMAESQRQVLQALDELHMATTCIRLRLPGEELANEAERAFKLLPAEVPEMSVRLTGDKVAALEGLRRARAQLRYLKSLAVSRKRAAEGGSVEEELCPVCQEKLSAEQQAVLHCGHALCLKCFLRIAERAQGGLESKRFACPTCRRAQLVKEVPIVQPLRGGQGADSGEAAGEEASQERQVEVKGSFGTKIEAVVRRLKWIARSDASAKVLLFSSWEDVLSVLEHALHANGVTYVRAKGGRGLAESINHFRGGDASSRSLSSATPSSSTASAVRPRPEGSGQAAVSGVQALLLPLKQGANGLNLVEAQHVVLVEPLLNPAAEAQAVNRVHRIGQTRPTFVHRFIVNDTVEEAVYSLGQRRAKRVCMAESSGVGANQRERDSLTIADIDALFARQGPSTGSNQSQK